MLSLRLNFQCIDISRLSKLVHRYIFPYQRVAAFWSKEDISQAPPPPPHPPSQAPRLLFKRCKSSLSCGVGEKYDVEGHCCVISIFSIVSLFSMVVKMFMLLFSYLGRYHFLLTSGFCSSGRARVFEDTETTDVCNSSKIPQLSLILAGSQKLNIYYFFKSCQDEICTYSTFPFFTEPQCTWSGWNFLGFLTNLRSSKLVCR